MDVTLDRAATDALARAASVATLAPSIHNTQPWRWRIHGAVADLYADPSRHLRIADPDRRLLTMSCGTALQHALVALEATGFAAVVDLLPTAGDPDHLARVEVTGTVTVTDSATALYEAIQVRRTDRRPLLDEPLPDGALVALRSAATAYGIGVHPLERDELADLAAATQKAQRVSLNAPAARTELDAWTSDRRPPFAGVPEENIPNRTLPTTVPVRDFGHIGTLATAGGRDDAATFAILYGPDDAPSTWLRAGEALSAVWLTATELGIALLPLTAAIEQPATRAILGGLLAGHGQPALAIRLGLANPNQPTAPRTPRLPVATIVEVQ